MFDFDRIVCMNLDKRTDRWKSSVLEFQKVGLRAERFSAITGDNQFLAYNNTYHTILSQSLGGSVLVLEDDVDFKSWHHLEEAMKELPQDWDVLYLGANLNGTKCDRYSEHLFKIRNSLTTHAVAYSAKMVSHIVENFKPNEFPVYDEWLRVNVQEQFKCFIVAPMICWQKKGYSDLWQRQVDYTLTFKEGDNLLK